jgi:hypothetical protein
MKVVLPAGYLSKRGRQWRRVRLLDLVTLLHNVYVGSEDIEVGFEDAQETLASLTLRLNKPVMLDPSLLESALWSCNLLDEKGKFWDAKGRPFDQFLKELLPHDRFNKQYNYLEDKE